MALKKNTQKLFSEEAVAELKSRVKEHFGSVEKLNFFIRQEYGITVASGTVYDVIAGKRSTSLENYRVIAEALKFGSILEAFPPLSNQKNGKTSSIAQEAPQG